MSVLDQLIRSPRLVETDHVELDALPALVWQANRMRVEAPRRTGRGV